MAAATLPHIRQYGPHHSYRAKDVHVELSAHFVQRGFLHHALVAVPSVINQHGQRPDASFNLSDRAADSVEVRHIENTSEGPFGIKGFKRPLRLGAAYCSDDAMTRSERLLREGTAKAAADAGNKKDLGI